MDFHQIRPPLVPSQLSADNQARDWVKEYANNSAQDLNGITWKIHLTATQRPSSNDTKKMVWEAKLVVEAVADREILFSSGIFGQKDSRLLNLVGTGHISIRLGSDCLQSESLESLKSLVTNRKLELIRKITKSDLSAFVKRSVGEWIDKRCKFGYHET